MDLLEFPPNIAGYVKLLYSYNVYSYVRVYNIHIYIYISYVTPKHPIFSLILPVASIPKKKQTNFRPNLAQQTM